MKWAQNLGDPGSCMREFKPSFFSECTGTTCGKSSQRHQTAWLAIAGDKDFIDNLKTSSTDMNEIREQYVSRCVVCESLYGLIIVHSDEDKPTCPQESADESPYEVACHPGSSPSRIPNRAGPLGQECQTGDTPWYGYSFWQIAESDFGLGVTSESAAACLMKFSHLPIIKCRSFGAFQSCGISSDSSVRSYWQMKSGQVADRNNIEFYQSERFFKRCAVCRRPEAKKLVLQGSSYRFNGKKKI